MKLEIFLTGRCRKLKKDNNFKEVILPSVGVISLSAILSLIVQNNIPNSMIGLIVVVILTTIIISLCIWIIGLKQVERNAVTKFLKKKLL